MQRQLPLPVLLVAGARCDASGATRVSANAAAGSGGAVHASGAATRLRLFDGARVLANAAPVAGAALYLEDGADASARGAIARPPTAPDCAGAPGGLKRRRGSI